MYHVCTLNGITRTRRRKEMIYKVINEIVRLVCRGGNYNHNDHDYDYKDKKPKEMI